MQAVLQIWIYSYTHLGNGETLGGPLKEVPQCVGGWKPEVHIWVSSLHILCALLTHILEYLLFQVLYVFPTCHSISPRFAICCFSERC